MSSRDRARPPRLPMTALLTIGTAGRSRVHPLLTRRSSAGVARNHVTPHRRRRRASRARSTKLDHRADVVGLRRGAAQHESSTSRLATEPTSATISLHGRRTSSAVSAPRTQLGDDPPCKTRGAAPRSCERVDARRAPREAARRARETSLLGVALLVSRDYTSSMIIRSRASIRVGARQCDALRGLAPAMRASRSTRAKLRTRAGLGDRTRSRLRVRPIDSVVAEMHSGYEWWPAHHRRRAPASRGDVCSFSGASALGGLAVRVESLRRTRRAFLSLSSHESPHASAALRSDAAKPTRVGVTYASTPLPPVDGDDVVQIGEHRFRGAAQRRMRSRDVCHSRYAPTPHPSTSSIVCVMRSSLRARVSSAAFRDGWSARGLVQSFFFVPRRDVHFSFDRRLRDRFFDRRLPYLISASACGGLMRCVFSGRGGRR